MMHLVCEVTTLLRVASEIQKLLFSKSANTGLAPTLKTELSVA